MKYFYNANLYYLLEITSCTVYTEEENAVVQFKNGEGDRYFWNITQGDLGHYPEAHAVSFSHVLRARGTQAPHHDLQRPARSGCAQARVEPSRPGHLSQPRWPRSLNQGPCSHFRVCSLYSLYLECSWTHSLSSFKMLLKRPQKSLPRMFWSRLP